MNEERKVRYVVQYQDFDAWFDGAVFTNDTEAFDLLKRTKVRPVRIVERITTEAVLFEEDAQ